MPRLLVSLNETEFRALQEIAQKELRGIKEQIRFMLREELIRQGAYFPLVDTPDTHAFHAERREPNGD
jgi:hypothetical protein